MLEIGLLGWVGISVCCGVIAGAKGRSGFGWFLLGLLFSVFALIIIAVIPTADRPPRPHTSGHINMSGTPRYKYTSKTKRLVGAVMLLGVIWLVYHKAGVTPGGHAKTVVEKLPAQ